jgi:hypothetical protein
MKVELSSQIPDTGHTNFLVTGGRKLSLHMDQHCQMTVYPACDIAQGVVLGEG